MLQHVLIELFERDLNRLKEEIDLYENEEKLWVIENGIKNSAGNLALHLLGNINHFVGAILGKTGYIRKREEEFSNKNISRNEILKEINKAIDMIKFVLAGIMDEEMQKDYPIEVFRNKGKMKVQYFLIHLTGHLNYHLGQINYHRRLIS